MASQAVATREQDSTNPMVVLRAQLEQRADEFRMVLPSHISPEKLQRTILTAVQLNSDLLNGDRRSFLTACFKAAQDGLLPDGREAALVVYNTRQKVNGQWATVKQVNYLPMVWGLRKKILQSEEIADLFAAVVYKQEIEAGHFIYEEGTERMLRHKPILDPAFVPTEEDIALVYSVATFKDGTKSFEVMRRSEVDRIRQLSQTGATGKTDREGKAIPPKGPWVDFYSEMAKKTVIRRHSKSLPMSGDVFADVEAAEIEAAARSAVAALSLAPGGQPQRIEDHTDEPSHDPETGEIIEEDTAEGTSESQNATDETSDDNRPEQETKPARGKKAQAPKAEDEQQTGEDEIGVTKHPAEAKAEQLLADMARVENIIDLDKLYGKAEADIAAMPDDVRGVVDAAYTRHTKRLSPAKAEAAEAGAK